MSHFQFIIDYKMVDEDSLLMDVDILEIEVEQKRRATTWILGLIPNCIPPRRIYQSWSWKKKICNNDYPLNVLPTKCFDVL